MDVEVEEPCTRVSAWHRRRRDEGSRTAPALEEGCDDSRARFDALFDRGRLARHLGESSEDNLYVKWSRASISGPAASASEAEKADGRTHLDVNTRSQPCPIARMVHRRQKTERNVRSEVVRPVREALEDDAETIA